MGDKTAEQATRDRAILIVRLASFGGVIGALGLSWGFSDLAEAYFSGKSAAPTAATPPEIPVAAAPVQKAPRVIQKVVHHPYQGGGAYYPVGSGPRPPALGPGQPPPPPPPPPCHSTPSKPC